MTRLDVQFILFYFFECLYFCFIKSTLARFGESPSFRIGVQLSGRGFRWDGESAPASLGKVAGRRWRNADKSCPDGVCRTGALYVVGGYSAFDFYSLLTWTAGSGGFFYTLLASQASQGFAAKGTASQRTRRRCRAGSLTSFLAWSHLKLSTRMTEPLGRSAAWR